MTNTTKATTTRTRNKKANPAEVNTVVTAVNMDANTGKVLESAVVNLPNTQGQSAVEMLKAAATATPAAQPAANDAPAQPELTARQRRRAARKELRAANMAAANAAGLKPIRKGTKRSKVFELLANPVKGITLDELVKQTGEPADSIRTVLNKNVKAKGYEVLKQQEGERGEVMYLGHKGNKIDVSGIVYAAPAAVKAAPAATAQ